MRGSALRSHDAGDLIEWLAGLTLVAGFVAIMVWPGQAPTVDVRAFAERVEIKVQDMRLRAIREDARQRLTVREDALVHEEETSSGWRAVETIARPRRVDVAGGPIDIGADAIAVPARLDISDGAGTTATVSISRVGLVLVAVVR